MRQDCPPGFRLYMPVLERICDFRPAGNGVHFRCPFPERHKNGDANWSGVAKIGGKGQLLILCNGCGAKWDEIGQWCGLPTAAFWPPDPAARPAKWRKRVQGKKIAEYPYHDASGKLIAVKYRWEPKAFTWSRPLPDDLRAKIDIKDECFAWVDGLGAGQYGGWQANDSTWYFRKVQGEQVPLFSLEKQEVSLYRLPELLASTGPVFVVEGEGKADLLAKLGHTAVSGPDGSSRWEAEWGEHFAGRGLIVIPDPDKVGMEWAGKVIGSAIGHGCKSIRLAAIPREEAPQTGKLKEWLAARPAKADFRALVTRSPMYQIQGT
jgi:hypothetical protein